MKEEGNKGKGLGEGGVLTERGGSNNKEEVQYMRATT